MTNSIMLIIFIMPVIALINLILNYSHFLMSLLSLECITLSLVLMVPMTLYISLCSNPTISIIILTLGACEASLGLSLMVIMSRTYGSDMLNSLTMNK
uniref:NADH dehydrogenase subunit 4L n=1 Tax=Drawida ghilarovi TaxID=994964 RepID=UPI0021B5009D|nr:NADH dehydrogenase subunit 4L [Drawida ghilarovi]UIX22934.1 NADH dehydrogenase subunit 4L [Drawida ghilarovi]UIX22947.1 NADH dehydrogenase subunit 4L [Drawida ghilarovi]